MVSFLPTDVEKTCFQVIKQDYGFVKIVANVVLQQMPITIEKNILR
jgi:hypothetical protein